MVANAGEFWALPIPSWGVRWVMSLLSGDGQKGGRPATRFLWRGLFFCGSTRLPMPAPWFAVPSGRCGHWRCQGLTRVSMTISQRITGSQRFWEAELATKVATILGQKTEGVNHSPPFEDRAAPQFATQASTFSGASVVGRYVKRLPFLNPPFTRGGQGSILLGRCESGSVLRQRDGQGRGRSQAACPVFLSRRRKRK
jgi:hypothetical protein